jgi:hypothetical protein
MRGVVRRALGFGRHENYVAEVTFPTMDGGVATVREYGVTEGTARIAAEATARRTLTARRRATGFGRRGEWRTPNTPATFRFGFAA